MTKIDYRTIQAFVLSRLHSQSQATVAKAAGLSPTRLSRLKATDLEDVCRVVAALGLAVVPEEEYRHTALLRMQLLGDE